MCENCGGDTPIEDCIGCWLRGDYQTPEEAEQEQKEIQEQMKIEVAKDVA